MSVECPRWLLYQSRHATVSSWASSLVLPRCPCCGVTRSKPHNVSLQALSEQSPFATHRTGHPQMPVLHATATPSRATRPPLASRSVVTPWRLLVPVFFSDQLAGSARVSLAKHAPGNDFLSRDVAPTAHTLSAPGRSLNIPLAAVILERILGLTNGFQTPLLRSAAAYCG